MSESELLYVLVFFFGFADAATTEIGLSLGYPESNPFFAPFVATFIFFVMLLFFDWSLFDRVPAMWKSRIQVCRCFLKGSLVLLALSPVLNNIIGLLGLYRFL